MKALTTNTSASAPASVCSIARSSFENDGSPVSTIIKGVKRAMAGEYSRELSVKVFTGQCRLIELGYRQGRPIWLRACAAAWLTKLGSPKASSQEENRRASRRTGLS